jgi:hypothetical protein
MVVQDRTRLIGRLNFTPLPAKIYLYLIVYIKSVSHPLVLPKLAPDFPLLFSDFSRKLLTYLRNSLLFPTAAA